MTWIAIGKPQGPVAFRANREIALAGLEDGDFHQELSELPDHEVVFDEQGVLIPVAVPLETLRIAKRRLVDQTLVQKTAEGFLVPFGPMTGQRLQVRDENDKSNWLTSQARYLRRVSSGQGGNTGAIFKTASNAIFDISFTEGLEVLDAMTDWGFAMIEYSWGLKAAVDAAPDATALDVIDITSGWPT